MAPVCSPEVVGSVEGTTSKVMEGSKLDRRLVFTEIGLTPLVTTPAPQPAPGFYSPSKPHSPPPSPLSFSKSESPRSLPKGSNINCSDNPKGHKHCRCKHSRCLNLYCSCFSLGVCCDGCSCVKCHNNVENEIMRAAAIDRVLGRNPHAFKPRIFYSPSAQVDRDAVKDVQLTGKQNRGCHCKKIHCIKKYCECFQANILCSENCKCIKCKNVERCEQRIAVSVVECDDANACIQQQNVATPTLGHPSHSFPQESRKRNLQKLLSPDIKCREIQELTCNQQEKSARAAGFLPALSIHPTRGLGSSAALISSKFTYRLTWLSIPADTILPLDTRQICALLVEASEAAKTFAEKNGTSEMQRASKSKTGASDTGTGNFEKEQKSKGMTLSPGKGEVSCDEKDESFMRAAPTFQNLYHHYNENFYSEQERQILTCFRDCLEKLVTSGRIKVFEKVVRISKPFLQALSGHENEHQGCTRSENNYN